MPTVSSLQDMISVFARFFDLIHQPITIINRQGRFIYYNQESAEIDGYSVELALGKHIFEVYTKLKEEESSIMCALKYGTEYIGNYQVYYNAKGQAVDYQHTTVPLYDAEGKIEGVIEIGRNMSTVRRLQEQVVELNQLLYSHSDESRYNIITDDPQMKKLINKAKRLATNDTPVVLIGDTGTGKELFARLIHRSSKRADKPFIALNCGALPLTLIESSLFGTVKGAFTGAENNKGYLELADGGTFFLDELNAMPIEMQSKLLRFLQDKSFWKIGGNKQIQSDVRIIAAMNESPSVLIEKNLLRADLFYRLSVGMIVLPTLSSRPGDIELLARFFIDKHRSIVNYDIQGISEHAILTLKNNSWPGNVRMLENVIVRSMVLQENDGPLVNIVYEEEMLMPAFIPPPLPVKEALSEVGLTERVERYERKLIVDALNLTNGSITQAACDLHISRTSLHYKIKKYNLKFGVLDGVFKD
ncbi:sigma 54-interacting transcriptional regulator [Serratia fonticola]|uniref:Sigma 54-interacting transcriptional regulator n=1 Tax=Serratia fonticola TaxID=47917 RepID=A0AAJ1YGY2_SERFO|nr:sigma 54-interacting transcriptional regulator [Serratia fonticola]MDQ9129882.1 sigma 54-interacting transcriptional regulator [Serratia fonticola]